MPVLPSLCSQTPVQHRNGWSASPGGNQRKIAADAIDGTNSTDIKGNFVTMLTVRLLDEALTLETWHQINQLDRSNSTDRKKQRQLLSDAFGRYFEKKLFDALYIYVQKYTLTRVCIPRPLMRTFLDTKSSQSKSQNSDMRIQPIGQVLTNFSGDAVDKLRSLGGTVRKTAGNLVKLMFRFGEQGANGSSTTIPETQVSNSGARTKTPKIKNCVVNNHCSYLKSCELLSWKCRYMSSGGLFFASKVGSSLGFVLVFPKNWWTKIPRALQTVLPETLDVGFYNIYS